MAINNEVCYYLFMKKEKSGLSRFEQAKPRTIVPFKENEALVKYYPRKGRLILPPAVLDHFDIKRTIGKPLFYELYFDFKSKEVAINFVAKKGDYTYTASDAKKSRFFEIGGTCERQGLVLKGSDKPVEIKIFKDVDEGFLFFSYLPFAENKK